MNLFQQIQKLQIVTLVCEQPKGTQSCQSSLTLPLSALGERELICPGCGAKLGQAAAAEARQLFDGLKGMAEKLRKLDMQRFHVRFEDE